MKTRILLLFLLIGSADIKSQDVTSSTWHVKASKIDPSNYYGVTVANGMVGLISSFEPMKVADVVLNGVYDNYQRGRVSNILKTFNHVNMELEVNGVRIGSKDIANYDQVLDMKNATLLTTFSAINKVSVR
ncbi:MAG TPA: glycoside hydrolase family 65 protein, partial [Cyclobacteriaceae bacterium]|nr:glycoside hydrolase family 65 protein [Cyclobacteriaceae bacterium]